MEIAKKKYMENTVTCRGIIRLALGQALTSCKEYITTRDPFALLNCFRVDVTILQDNADANARSGQYRLEEE